MAREKKPTKAELPLLEDLRRAADLRSESYRLYLALFRKALKEGISPSVIARYAGVTPQAANSTKNRLAGNSDRGAPKSVEEVFDRVERHSQRRRRHAS
jgi:hypothetical protein